MKRQKESAFSNITWSVLGNAILVTLKRPAPVPQRLDSSIVQAQICSGLNEKQLERVFNLLRVRVLFTFKCRSCWNQLPEKRPCAEEIVREMEEPAFLCQCRLVPESNEGLLEKVTTINVLATTGTLRRLGSISIREEFLLYC